MLQWCVGQPSCAILGRDCLYRSIGSKFRAAAFTHTHTHIHRFMCAEVQWAIPWQVYHKV